MVLMIHLDFNDLDPGYVLYKIEENDLERAKSVALAAKAKWGEGRTNETIEELIDDEFKTYGIPYESLAYDVLSLYMF